jgi:hypothetical protein
MKIDGEVVDIAAETQAREDLKTAGALRADVTTLVTARVGIWKKLGATEERVAQRLLTFAAQLAGWTLALVADRMPYPEKFAVETTPELASQITRTALRILDETKKARVAKAAGTKQ